MAPRLVVPLAVLALTAAACSGGDSAADTTLPAPAPTTPATTAAPPTTAAPTTLPTTTTTAPPTTTPATTAPPTTAPSTAPVVTASTLPLPVPEGFTLEEVQAIDRDFREGYQLLYAALTNVNDEAAVEAALAYTTADEATNAAAVLESFRSENRRLERLPSPLESFEILQGPTRLANGDIGLLICHVAPYRTVQDVGDSGTATSVLNDGVVTQQISVDLRLEDGVWKRSVRLLDEQWRGAVRCQDMS